jgi:hypothetical protein
VKDSHVKLKLIQLLALFISFNTYCQNDESQQTGSDPVTENDVKDLKKEVKSIKDILKENHGKPITLGLSIGWRWINDNTNTFENASISPIDSTLKLEKLDKSAVVLSTAIVISPFYTVGFLKKQSDVANQQVDNAVDNAKKPEKGDYLRAIGLNLLKSTSIIGTLNLLELSAAQEQVKFNTIIEGGIGLGVKMGDGVFLGMTWEKVLSRQLRTHLKEQVDKKIYYENKIVTSLDETDDKFYLTRSFSAISIKVIVSL